MMLEPIELTYELRCSRAGGQHFAGGATSCGMGRSSAAGWRLSALHAQRALRAQAIRYAHRLHGVHALHPDRTPPAEEAPWSGRRVAVKSGDLRAPLTPQRSSTPRRSGAPTA